MSKLAEAFEMLKEVDELKEIINLFIKEAFPYIERTSDAIVELKTRSIRKYIDNGFTKEEAILLTIDSVNSLIKSIDKYKAGDK